jgi:hypothetical protein
MHAGLYWTPKMSRPSGVRLLASLLGVLSLGACGGEKKATVSAPLCADAPGPAPLRRQTRFEYGRTLHDLTGVDAAIAERLPPDEETLGFDDIATAYSVSTLHTSRYLDVAEEAATKLTGDSARLTAFGGCDPRGGDAACVAAFIAGFGSSAWRRPLDPDEAAAMEALYVAAADPAPTDGVSAVVAAMLQAPQFLYRPEPTGEASMTTPLDGYALATRLAYLLTGAGPDATLLAAAADGNLTSDDVLLAETDRLLASDRAAELFVHFATSWWELESVPTLDKDRTLYRTWTDEIPAAMAEETRLFLTGAWTTGPTLATLLTAPATYVNPTLAAFYGLPPTSGAGFEKVALDPARGSGMLTQGSFLAAHAKPDQTSPTLRGKFVMAQLFCSAPPPPPPDIVIRPPVVDPRLSTRERFAQHTVDQRCADCHIYMDPLGFSFEHFDATGRWRDNDGGKPVDASGMVQGTDVEGPIDGVPSLAAKLIESPQVAHCAATQWFRYAFGRSEQTAGDRCTVTALADALDAPKGDFRQMVRATVRMAQFRNRPPEAQ